MKHSSASTSAVQVFKFKSTHSVRTAFDDKGEPLFCLTDVADILDISNANPSRFNLDVAGIHKMYISHPSGRKETTFINEANLYRVIFRSNKPEAVKFQNWVFDDVLPTLRKTGSYHIAEPVTPTPSHCTKLSTADYRKLQDVVSIMAKGLKYDQCAEHAIYTRLRSLCEVKSVKDIRYEQMGMVTADLARINRTIRPYVDYRRQCEKVLFRRICMGDDKAVWEAIQMMDETSGEYATSIDNIIAQRLERIGHRVEHG